MEQKEKITQVERKILQHLCSSKNKNGLYELFLDQYTFGKEELSLERLADEFDDKAFSDLLHQLYNDSIDICKFIERIKKILQISIKRQVVSGRATYKYMKNVAFIAEMEWVTDAAFKESASKKVKVMYFYKRFEQMFILSSNLATQREKIELLTEYISQAEKGSYYIIGLFFEKNCLSEDSSNTIFKEIKNSF